MNLILNVFWQNTIIVHFFTKRPSCGTLFPMRSEPTLVGNCG